MRCMLKSRLKLNSKHRHGSPCRVKKQGQHTQGCWNWQTSRPQTPVFLTCGFKSRPLHQVKNDRANGSVFFSLPEQVTGGLQLSLQTSR